MALEMCRSVGWAQQLWFLVTCKGRVIPWHNIYSFFFFFFSKLSQIYDTGYGITSNQNKYIRILVDSNFAWGSVCLTPGVSHFTAFMCSSTNNIYIQPVPQSTKWQVHSLQIVNPCFSKPERWDKVDELFHVIPFVKLQSITTWWPRIIQLAACVLSQRGQWEASPETELWRLTSQNLTLFFIHSRRKALTRVFLDCTSY
jgi:hypothetical protein